MKGWERYRSLWLWSFAFFLLAAATGLLYRLELLLPLPFDLSLSNIRHAHSHLMFFNWVTPVPMLFMAVWLTRQVPRAERSLKRAISAVLLIGFASWPFFLLYGYGSVEIGSASLPLSVILSGLVMVVWYRFAWIWFRHRKRLDITGRFHEAALVMLIVSSFGAWGIAVFQFTEIDHPLLAASLTHFFLAVFTHGWCLLSLFGILSDAGEGGSGNGREGVAVAAIALAAPLTFPFGLSSELLSDGLLWTARTGALLLAAGLIAGLQSVYRQTISLPAGRLLSGLLLILAVMLLASVAIPGRFWLGDHALRVFYLHHLLLGVVTLSYLAVWHHLHPESRARGFGTFSATVLLLLGALLLATGTLPLIPIGGWIWPLLAFTALLPILAGFWQWAVMYSSVPPVSGGSHSSGDSGSALLNKVDKVNHAVKKQKEADHPADRAGVGDNEQGEDQHEHSQRNQFERNEKCKSEKGEKKGERVGNQVRKEKDQQRGESGECGEERTYTKIEENYGKYRKISPGHIVDQVGPSENEYSGKGRKKSIEQFPFSGIASDGDLDLLVHGSPAGDRFCQSNQSATHDKNGKAMHPFVPFPKCFDKTAVSFNAGITIFRP